MYPSIPRLQDLHDSKDEDRPIVLCEYSHSMNNSNGNLHLYWKKFWDPAFPRLQGGFIWDFKDQGLRKKTRDGRSYFAYGGDFGDTINDQQFCINGMFSPDLEPHPSVHEIKYLQQPVKIMIDPPSETILLLLTVSNDGSARVLDSTTNKGATSLRLLNRYTFRDLSHLHWTWEVCCSISQYPIATGSGAGSGAENNQGRLDVDWSKAAAHFGELESKQKDLRYFLNVAGVLKEDTSWAKAGHVIAREQFSIQFKTDDSAADPPEIVAPIQYDTRAQVSVRETRDTLGVVAQSDDSSALPFVVFSKHTGSILSLCWDGETDILGRKGMSPNFTRATTDNDRGGLELILEHMMLKWAQPIVFVTKGYDHFSHYLHWKENGLAQDQPPRVVCDQMSFDQQGHVVVIRAECSVKNVVGRVLLKQLTTFTVCGQSQQIQIHSKVVPQQCLRHIPSLPRIGWSLELNSSLHRIRYFGRGPNETYPDRKTGSAMGVYQTSPSTMGYDYIVPSENGNRSDCQWACWDNGHKNGLLVVASDSKKSASFEFSSLLHTADELNHARHTYDLDERKDGEHPIFVNVDHKLMGLGGDVR
jgi:beta-galactosidase